MVLVVCILLSIVAFGGGALARERKKVLKVFNDGADTSLSTRHSMDAYLDSAADCALIMASEVEINQGESQLTKDMNEAATDLKNDKLDLDTRYQRFESLKTNAEKAYSSLYSKVSESEFRDFKLAYDDFKGYVDMAERDEYHKLAKSYNNLISGFPGGLVATITGQGELSTFGS